MGLLEGPTEVQLKLIKIELKEDEDRFQNNLELLKTWIKYQEHMPKNYDERLLPIYLRGCKHDLEKTKRKLEIYFSVKSQIPEIFANRDTTSKEGLQAAKTMALVPLKKLNSDGTRVSVYKLCSNDPNHCNVVEIVKLFCILGDIRVVEEFPISGDVLILDFGHNMTAAHVAKGINYVVARGMMVANEAYPQRVKKLHVINLPEIGEKFINLLKSFTKEKIRNRFIFHKKPQDLLDFIDRDILPCEYGGNGESLATLHKAWQEYFIEKNSWIQQQEKIICQGPVPKHLLQTCAFDSNAGIQGSFRKLAID